MTQPLCIISFHPHASNFFFVVLNEDRATSWGKITHQNTRRHRLYLCRNPSKAPGTPTLFSLSPLIFSQSPARCASQAEGCCCCKMCSFSQPRAAAADKRFSLCPFHPKNQASKPPPGNLSAFPSHPPQCLSLPTPPPTHDVASFLPSSPLPCVSPSYVAEHLEA